MRRFATEFINPAIMKDPRVQQALTPQIGAGAFDRLQQQKVYDDAIMRQARGMGQASETGLPTPPPKMSMDLMNKLTPAMGSPAQAGLGAAAATGLQLSGYRKVPITTGEGLGAMMQAGMKAYQDTKRANLADRIAMAKLGKESAFMEKLRLAGLNPNNPADQKAIRDMLMKPESQVNVDLGKKFGEENIKFAFGQLKDEMAELRQSRSLLPKINTVIPILEAAIAEGKDLTGIVSSATFPFRKAMVEANLLGEDAAKDVADFEVLRSATAFMIPRMRVVGSGATSDFEAKMMQDAIPNMLNSVRGNLVIAALFKQTTEHNMARTQLMERFINKHQGLYDEKGDIGFGDYADKTLDKVFYTVGTEEELTELVDAGKIKKGQAYFNSNPDFNQFIIYRGE